jgi:hypothetical protein
MNANDPILTAFALDELEPRDRAQIEQFIRDNPQVADEVEELRGVASLLSATLKNEASAGLAKVQREQVYRIAGVSEKPKLPTNVVDGPSWWTSWQFVATAAACMIFGFGAYAMFDALTERRPIYATEGSTTEVLSIGVPSDDSDRRYIRVSAENSGKPVEPQTGERSLGLPSAVQTPQIKLAVTTPSIEAKLQPSESFPNVVADTPRTQDVVADALVASRPPAAKRSFGSGREERVGFKMQRPSTVPNAKDSVVFRTRMESTAARPVASVPLQFTPETLAPVIRELSNTGRINGRTAVDIHGLVNSFKYDAATFQNQPLLLTAELGDFPADPAQKLLRVSIQARSGSAEEIVAEGLVAEIEFNPGRVQSFAFMGVGESGVAPTPKPVSLLAGEQISSLCLVVPQAKQAGGNFLTVKLRYRLPGSVKEVAISQTPAGVRGAGSEDFKWMASVASFGWALAHGESRATAWSRIEKSVTSLSKNSGDLARSEFADLVQKIRRGVL